MRFFMPLTIQNRSPGSLVLKVRAYQARTLVNLRSCFLLRAEKVEKSAQGCCGGRDTRVISILEK
jgi:hypothetical protein